MANGAVAGSERQPAGRASRTVPFAPASFSVPTSAVSANDFEFSGVTPACGEIRTETEGVTISGFITVPRPFS